MIMTQFDKPNEKYVIRKGSVNDETLINDVCFYNFKELLNQFNEKRTKSHREKILTTFFRK